MSLFSFASKTKQEAASGEGEFYSRAEEESQAARGRKPRKSSKSSKSPVDPVLPEKKRARRRLVGAIALVLAMIIGLPMILDSEPKRVSDDIAIQIPSKDKPGALPVATLSAASTVSASLPASASVPLTASLGQQEQIVNLPPPNAGTGGNNGSNAAVPSSATPARMPAPAVEPATPAANASKPKAKEDVKPPAAAGHEAADARPVEAKPQAKVEHDDKRAEAILEGKDVDGAKSSADKKPGKFIVQVAALASQEKVDELQGKLTEAGIKSYVQKVATDSGERVMRVRLGPFANKEEAESARAKLGKLGLNGKLLPSS